MPMYAISILPIIRRLANDNVQQVWYADDTTATGKLMYCEGGGTNWKCWVRLLDITQIRLKPGSLPRKNILTWLLILSRILMSKLLRREGVIKEFVMKAVEEQVKERCFEVDNSSTIAATRLHAAYSAFTHGLFGKWTFLWWTCADIESLLVPLEESLRMKFIPSLTGRPPTNDTERDILALPPRLRIRFEKPSEVQFRRVLNFKKDLSATIGEGDWSEHVLPI